MVERLGASVISFAPGSSMAATSLLEAYSCRTWAEAVSMNALEDYALSRSTRSSIPNEPGCLRGSA